jgi:hypothetical protein
MEMNFMRRYARCLLVFSAMLVVPAVRADPMVYNNGAPNQVSGNEITQWIQAENFVLPVATTITDVHFWGVGFTGAYTGSITWQIYANNGTNPGALLSHGTQAVAAVATGNTLSFGNEYALDFNIDSFAAAAGTTYWLGLHNGPLATTDRRNFYWETTGAVHSPTGHELVAPFGGTDWFDNGQEHAFYLTGVSGVPEPTSLVLFGTVLAGIVASMRRSTRRQ